jgi:malonyl-ACP O-methyltransferase BioC
MTVELIKNRFNKACKTYNQVSGIQKESADVLAALLQSTTTKAPDSILDIGCGTGHLSSILHNKFPSACLFLNDLCPEMLNHCKERFRHSPFSYIQGDMHTIAIPKVSWAVSNFCFQWSNDLIRLLDRYYQNSSLLGFTTLLSDSFKEWHSLLSKMDSSFLPNSYPDSSSLIKEISSHFVGSTYCFEQKTFHLNFNNPLEVLTYLKKLGATFSKTPLSFKAMKQLIHTQTPITLSYRVLFGVINKPCMSL